MTALPKNLPLAVPATLGVVAAGAGAWLLVRAVRWRKDPAERERRRRIHIHVNGRMGEAMLYQASVTKLRYRYQLAGVAYDTSQDISGIHELLPREPERLLGPALVKYDPRNPFNSIVICEHWSGFRESKQS
ncbi:MAG: hypothetical protein FJW30_20490 [Acidobacteria bacterium]|nr:hypothetical protein [Acidobacteriota bacterium]